ncbi:MAG: hypothetical protein H6713_38305 [Myxococcales bacterium]|nr:hypothetical protein [Myxococcales bacterium]
MSSSPALALAASSSVGSLVALGRSGAGDRDEQQLRRRAPIVAPRSTSFTPD